VITFGLLDDRPRSREKLREIHNQLFKNTDASLEWFEWYFDTLQLDNRPSPVRVYSASEGDRLVGIWCVEPKLFSIDGRRTFVGRCFSVGIHADYRRQGLFVDLSKFAIESERARGELEYVIGFPQEGKPVIEAHLKAGWDRVQLVRMRSLVPSRPAFPVSLSSVRTVNHLREGFHDLTNWHRPSNGTQDPNVSGFLQTSTYMNSKWLLHPDHNYVCLFGVEEDPTSHVVIKQYGSVGHILDVGGSHSGVAHLLEASKTLAYRHRWDELTIWCADNEHFHDVIVDAGFTPGARYGLSVEVLAVKINATVPLQLRTVQFSMSCEEIY